HAQRMALADAFDFLDKRGVLAAHQLNGAAIAAVAESADHIDRIRALKRDIEEKKIRRLLVERGDRALRAFEFARQDADFVQAVRNDLPDARLVIDDKTTGAKLLLARALRSTRFFTRHAWRDRVLRCHGPGTLPAAPRCGQRTKTLET